MSAEREGRMSERVGATMSWNVGRRQGKRLFRGFLLGGSWQSGGLPPRLVHIYLGPWLLTLRFGSAR